MNDEKVTNIKYKQMDKDPVIKENINMMEQQILGEKGVGLLNALGLSPGKIQKHLDDEMDREIDRIKEENKEYIIKERIDRALKKVEDQLKEGNKFDLVIEMQEAIKEAELDIIKELMEKEGL